MSKLLFDYKGASLFLNDSEINNLSHFVTCAHEMLHNKTGAGNDFLGWVDYPIDFDKQEFLKIQESANKIKNDSDVLVVIGIGGSYLGAKAVIDSLSHSFYNSLPKSKRKTPEIYFAGNNISSTYLSDLLELLEDKNFSINVISKSGTTTEPALAFRVLKNYLEERYGKIDARKRIYVTTDKEKGALKKLSVEEGYTTFVIPDDVGGRFSVLTSVGLLPIAVSGANINNIMEGAKDAYYTYNNPKLASNDCYKYAVCRNVLYSKNKTVELLVNYEPSLQYLVEWWKQLFGESEGKDQKGIFPAGANFTTDLHSMGQYIQAGLRNIFETVINVENPRKNINIDDSPKNIDGLNFLSNKDINFVNKKAFEGTMLAHTEGGVPNLVIKVPSLDEYNIGSLIYFFEKACGISGYLLGVNPFDQPGVEAYKKNMFALLGKPGFENERERLENILKG
jgi:glucose-6-phosphate isomerase